MLDEMRAVQRAAADTAGPPPPAAAPAADGWRARLQAAPAHKRRELLLSFVGEQVARVIDATSAEAIDPKQPLNELGLDSLMAVELRNRLGSGLQLQRSLPATLVFDHPTLEALARHLDETAFADSPNGDDAPSGTSATPDAVGTIDELSDDEVDRLFAEKLRRS